MILPHGGAAPAGLYPVRVQGFGVDIGGSGIKGCLVDLEQGQLIGERLRIETPQPSLPDPVYAVVAEIVDRFGWTGRMGVTFPGVMKSGVAHTAANVDKSWIGTDVDADLEQLIERMTRLLLIEISAFHTFAWAEEVLSDGDLVAGDGEAARLVSYIRADETPHVAYLKTTLSEMRDRTFLGSSGRRYAGADMVGRIWDRALGDSLGVRREAGVKLALSEVEHALDGHPKRADLLAEFHSLATPEVAA